MPSRIEGAKVLVVTPNPESPRRSALATALSGADHHAELSTGIGVARVRARVLAGQGAEIKAAFLDFPLSHSLFVTPEAESLVTELQQLFPNIKLVEALGVDPEEIARRVTDF